MWKNLVPKKTPEKAYTEEIQIDWSELEKMLMRICNQISLTSAQRDKLSLSVIVIEDINTVTTKDSPIILYAASGTFREFAYEKAKTMREHGASVGKIIQAICNYTHPHGWLSYEKEHGSIFKGNYSEEKYREKYNVQQAIPGGILPGVKS